MASSHDVLAGMVFSGLSKQRDGVTSTWKL